MFIVASSLAVAQPSKQMDKYEYAGSCVGTAIEAKNKGVDLKAMPAAARNNFMRINNELMPMFAKWESKIDECSRTGSQYSSAGQCLDAKITDKNAAKFWINAVGQMLYVRQNLDARAAEARASLVCAGADLK